MVGFIIDPSMIIDLVAILPFFVEVGFYLTDKELQKSTEFSKYLGSCGEACRPTAMYLFKLTTVLRILKLTRHHAGVRILYDTVHTSWRKLALPFLFLVIMSIVLAILFYFAESGYKCTSVTEDGECTDAIDIWGVSQPNLALNNDANEFKPGFDYYVAWDGNPTQMPSALEGCWLAWVSLTSVGYGRLYPRKNIGRAIGVFAMLFGSFYLAMPLYIIGGSFYTCWKRNEAKAAQLKKFIMPAHLVQQANAAKSAAKKKSLYELPAKECTALWKYKNIAYTLETCSNALKAVIERVIAEAEIESRKIKSAAEREKNNRMSLSPNVIRLTGESAEGGGSPSLGVGVGSFSRRKSKEEMDLTPEEIRDRVMRFSRHEAAWNIEVNSKATSAVFECVRECQLGHMALSKLVRTVDEGLHSIQPPRRKKVVNYSIFHAAPS